MTDREETILKAIAHVGRGGPAEISKVIKAVGYPKAAVKHTLIELLQKGVVVLHRHDWPQSLKPSERKNMLLLAGSYYGAVSMGKRGANPSARKLPLPIEWQAKAISWGGVRWQHRQEEGDDVYDRPFPKETDLEWYLADRYGWKFAKKVLAMLKTSGGEVVGVRRNPRDQHLPGLPRKAQREYEHVLKTELEMGRTKKRAKQIAAGKVRKDYGSNPRKRNARKIADPTLVERYNIGKAIVSIRSTPDGKYTASWRIRGVPGFETGISPSGLNQYQRRKFETIAEAKRAVAGYNQNPKRKRNQSTYYVVYEGSQDGGSFYDERWDKLEDAKAFVAEKKRRAMSRGYDVGWWQWIIYRRPGSGLVSYRTSTADKNPKRKKNTTVIKAKKIGRVIVRKVANPKRMANRDYPYWNVYHIDTKKTSPYDKTFLGSSHFNATKAEAIEQFKRSHYPGRLRAGTKIVAEKAVITENSKRSRNLGHKDSDHPVEVKHHFRAGPPGYLTPWQRAHAAGQSQLFETGIKPAKRRNPSAGDSAKWEKLWGNYIKALKDEDAAKAKLRGKVTPQFRAVRMRVAKAAKAIQKFDPDFYARVIAGRRNPLIQPGRRYKMKPDYEPTAMIEAGMRGGFKATFIAKDGMAGMVGGFATRAEATAWAKRQGFKVVQKKKRNASVSRNSKSLARGRAGSSSSGSKAARSPRRKTSRAKRNALTPTGLARKAVKTVKRVIGRNPLKRHAMPAWIKRTIQRARREGADSAANWELMHATKAMLDGFDQYLISINHPSVYEAGSQEYRVKRFVRERIGKRKTRNPSASAIRKNFAGRHERDSKLIFPNGTPSGLAKLGRLVSISTDAGRIAPVNGTAWLCSDTRGKLHIGTPTKGHVVFGGPATNYGHVREVEYEESKPHLGYTKKTLFFHKLGEETGVKPRLVTDGKGGAKFVGGAYKIKREGIIN